MIILAQPALATVLAQMEAAQLLQPALAVKVAHDALGPLGIVDKQLNAREGPRLQGVVAHNFCQVASAPLDTQP
jgi:hypothetical protein